MRCVSKNLKQLESDPRMKRCALADKQDQCGPCWGRVEWEHAWIYASHQIDRPWAIIGVCHKHHMMKDGNRAVKAGIETASLAFAMPFVKHARPSAGDEPLSTHMRHSLATSGFRKADTRPTSGCDRPAMRFGIAIQRDGLRARSS